MPNKPPIWIKTITEFHKLSGLPKPEHPLISVVKMEDINIPPSADEISIVFDFYFISLKRVQNATYKYGQNDYDLAMEDCFLCRLIRF